MIREPFPLPHVRILWSGASIVTKLSLLYGVLITIFVGFLAAAAYSGAVRVMEEEAAANARLALEQVRNSVDATLESIDKDSYIVFANPDVLRALKLPGGLMEMDGRLRYAVEKLATDVTFSNGAVDGLVLYDMKGGRLKSNPTSSDVDFGELVSRALAADGRFALVEYDRGSELIVMARLVRDMDMKPVGYLRADARGTSFRMAFSDELLDSGASLMIVDGDRIVVSAGVEIPGDQVFAALASTEGTGPASYRSGGAAYTVNFFESRHYSWQVVGFVPSGRIGAAALRLRSLTAGISGATILAFFLISLVLTRSFLLPIHRIAEDMRHWNLSTVVSAETYGGTDEVAYLSSQFSSMMDRIRTLVDQSVEEKSRLHRQELAALQAQINPHFLYNTLEIVNWMAIERGAGEIASIVRALSDMMRYALGDGSDTVSVAEEIAYLERYIAIQAYRFPDKFDFRVEASEAARAFSMPKLSLQPIVENSVVHAFKGIKRKGTILVRAAVEGGALVVQVEDDGIGMDARALGALLSEHPNDRTTEHAGIGVANVDRRLRLRYGGDSGLSYTSGPGAGTKCVLRIPSREVPRA